LRMKRLLSSLPIVGKLKIIPVLSNLHQLVIHA